MADEGLSHATLCQIAFVVDDIEKAAKAWAAVLGLPTPGWSMVDPYETSHAQYKGKPTAARAKMAFFQLGSMAIELIEPVGGPSTWRDDLGAGGSRIHHIAFQVKDAEQATQCLERQGIRVVQTGDYPGGRYVYLDAVSHLGTVLELLATRQG
jgi:catechol 2,3-dioxygenase-like lactoylglutathione lyase family enzyme